MSKPFGTMPADHELAAFGSGAGGLLLGAATSELVAGAMQVGRPGGTLSGVTWLHVVFAIVAVVSVSQISSWALRIALVGFAIAQLLSVSWIAGLLRLPWWMTTGLHALVACALLLAAWPRASRRARFVTVALFIAVMTMKTWLIDQR